MLTCSGEVARQVVWLGRCAVVTRANIWARQRSGGTTGHRIRVVLRSRRSRVASVGARNIGSIVRKHICCVQELHGAGNLAAKFGVASLGGVAATGQEATFAVAAQLEAAGGESAGE